MGGAWLRGWRREQRLKGCGDRSLSRICELSSEHKETPAQLRAWGEEKSREKQGEAGKIREKQRGV